jgi:hypothetical protein
MPATHKSRIISFRLSEEEYQAIETVSYRHGYTSVSLFARGPTLTTRSYQPACGGVDEELARLWRRIDAIITTIELLMTYFRPATAPPPQQGGTDEGQQCVRALEKALDTEAKALAQVLAARHKVLIMQAVPTSYYQRSSHVDDR